MEQNSRIIINQRVKETIDNVTGEIVKTEAEHYNKMPQTPDFVMAFTQDLSFIANLSGTASKLLFGVLAKVNRSNEVVLVKEIKEELVNITGLKYSTINKVITELYHSKVLLKAKENSRSCRYILNPYYFGKGKWVNVNKLRMIVEYDFANSKRTFGVETEYIDRKDDIIGQLIDNQDYILDNLSKNNKNILIDSNKAIKEISNITKEQNIKIADDIEDIKKYNSENKKYDISIIDDDKKNKIFKIERDLENYRYQTKAEVLNDISVAVYNSHFYEIDFEKRKEIARIYNNFAVVKSGEVKDCLLGLMFQNLLDEVKN